VGVCSPLVLVVNDRVGRVHDEPDADAHELQRDEAEGDDQLGSRADEPGGTHRLLALLEDAVDAVGLGEQGSVADAHAEPEEDASQGARAQVRLGDHEEGGGVAEEDACQQDIAQLPPRRLDDGRIVVAHEGDHHKEGGNDAHDGNEDWDHGPGRAPLQLDDGDGGAAGVVLVGPLVEVAPLAVELIQLVLVAVAALAVPAAGNALHQLLPLARLAGQAADGAGELAPTPRPQHALHLRGETTTAPVALEVGICRASLGHGGLLPLCSRQCCSDPAPHPTSTPHGGPQPYPTWGQGGGEALHRLFGKIQRQKPKPKSLLP